MKAESVDVQRLEAGAHAASPAPAGAAATAASPAAAISAARRRGNVALLTAVSACSWVDRRIFDMLLQPIKLEFDLSDAQLGFLAGLAFAIFYAGFGIPLAWLADRRSRKWIIVASLTIFATMTTVCGLAQTYWQLVLLRMFVGIGEAGTVPQSHSLISDLYPQRRRAGPLALYIAGGSCGGLFLGYLAGGALSQSLGWRHTLLLVGGPGLLLAALVAGLLLETPRGLSDDRDDSVATATEVEAAGGVGATPISDVLRVVWRCRSIFHVFAGTCTIIFGGSSSAFTPALLARSPHGLQPTTIGVVLAISAGVVGFVGTWGYGVLSDRLAERSAVFLSAGLVVQFATTLGFCFTSNTAVAVGCLMLSGLIAVSTTTGDALSRCAPR